jgi:mycothiol synthase
VTPLSPFCGITYFKRFRMEIELYDPPAWPNLPAGFAFVPWDESLLEAHAEILSSSFNEEIDASVFPSLGSRRGCSQLMGAIAGRPGFLPEATWLLTQGEYLCGTIQGVRDRIGVGAIQNLGVAPVYRGLGLGRALLLQALHGFRMRGLGRAFLEVTAQNDGAVRLYHNVGFRRRKTVYKAVDTAATVG